MPRWIHLTKENRALITGDRRTVQQGYWIVLRIFRIGQYSKYWNPDVKQAVGGPKYLYDDFVVRTITKPGSGTGISQGINSSGVNTILNSGDDDFESITFAILADENLSRVPQEEDIIFQIDKYSGKDKPIPPYKATDRYQITHVIPIHGDLGKIEIIYITAKRIHGVS